MLLIDNFQPPDGTRLIWHSPAAREEWEPRVQQISNAHSALERETVAQGMRLLVQQPISRGFEYERISDWARNRGLSIMPIRAVGRFNGFAHRYISGDDMYVTAIGARPEYVESDHPEQYLGYPPCCQEFFFANFPRFIDPVWQWAGGTDDADSITITASPYSNPLLRYWSLRFVFHIPCSPNCERSIFLGQRFETLMTADERAWLLELLSGEIRWTCLHGIAEVHTKHFRIISPSNPSARRYEVVAKPL